MAKLVCETHNRRVHVFAATSTIPVVIHRNGDGSKCSSPNLKIKDRKFSPVEVVFGR